MILKIQVKVFRIVMLCTVVVGEDGGSELF
jgi:hypothetical protein